MKLTLTRKISCIAALLCAAAWNANAVNLVNDGGFEASTGDGTFGPHPFSPAWSNTDSSNFSGVGGLPSPQAHSGTNYAVLGAFETTGILSQSLTTVAGTFYTLSFWLANDITPGQFGPTSAFEVFWNGASVLALPANSAPFGYTNFTISGLQATGAATTLAFHYRHDNDFWRLDDCSVTVPESTSTIWLALPTFAALGLVYSRRTRKGMARA
jgi:hypothetical protein